MPHAFNGHPVVPYLVRLHADLGDQIKANQAKAVRLAAMKHVEAVIKLYDPEYSVRSISIRRRVTAPGRRGRRALISPDKARICGRPVRYEITPRRSGDPPVLVGDATRCQSTLGWQPVRSELHLQVRDAWNWMYREAHRPGP